MDGLKAFAGAVFMLAVLAALLVLYFLPAIVAQKRSHHNRTAILVLDLLAGWTVLGWIIAMVWATTVVRED